MQISDKIRFIRKELLKQTQQVFALEIGVTRNTVKNWEIGTSKPITPHLLMIGMLGGVSLDYLLFDDVELQFSINDLDDEQYEILTKLVLYIRNKSIKSHV